MIPVSFTHNIPFFSIFLPLLTAVVSPLLPCRRREAEKLTLTVLAVLALLSSLLLADLAGTGRSFTFRMGHYPAPWGNELRAGPLEALLALVFSVSMFLSLLGNSDTTAEDVSRERRPLFCSLMNLLMSSLLALVYTNDLFTAYVFIEINTIAACAVVAVNENGETVRAALRYLVMSLAGSGLVLISICLLYDLTGHLLMQNMHLAILELVQAERCTRPLLAALSLMMVGLAIKSALYPFASWLPDAHGNASNASSAVLSGLVLKGHIFLLIKVFHRVFGTEAVSLLQADRALLVFGILGMIMGSLHALRQTNIKRMIAWSSVAQVGYIFLGIALNTVAGAAAACLHIIVHAAVKPMLFTAAGGLISASGHRKLLHDLRGSFYRNRWAGLGLIAGTFSMIGVPAFAGFASKFNLALACFSSSAVVPGLIALALSSVLNALYYVPAVVVVMTPGAPPQEAPTVRSPFYAPVMAAFITLTLVLGLFCIPLLQVIRKGVLALG